jgi:transposase
VSDESFLSGQSVERVIRRRRRRDPKPRFKKDTSRQLDAVQGCPAMSVPENHLARSVWGVVSRLDTNALEDQYSSLGRRGYHPRHVLAVWVYASLIGLHHSTKVAAAVATDAAFRLLSGGHSISGATLRRFRQRNARFFSLAIEHTVQLASHLGLIDLEALAVDSVRIRAHASPAAVRTVSRSSKRLDELSSLDEATLDETEREAHRAKLEKHRTALELCRQRDSTSVVLTNDAAALMKFPSGASAPAHRTTIVATGASSRFVVGVLVDADSTDHGKLGEALCRARDVLDRLGLRNEHRLVAAADGGYAFDADFEFAFKNRDWVDVLIPERSVGRYARFFGRDRFVVHPDLTATCPAGTQMLGPYSNSRKNPDELKWVGVGCSTCPLKPNCTDGKVRALQLDLQREKHRQHMQTRMGQPGAAERYNKRIATVEPVFSHLESTMEFRRCSSRSSETVLSEILLNVLAYNIDRLIRAERNRRKLYCVLIAIDQF